MTGFPSFSVLAALGLSLMLAGCGGEQSQRTVSLSEAEAITAKFVGAEVAPPRSVDDLLELVAHYDRPAEADALRDIRHVARLKPDEGTRSDPASLAEFLVKRASARLETGEGAGAIADAREAYRLSRVEKPSEYGEFLRMIGWAEFLYGKMDAAVSRFNEARKHVHSNRRHRVHSALARVLARRGELDEAREYVDAVESWESNPDRYKFHTYRTKGYIAGLEGRFVDAERFHRLDISETRRFSREKGQKAWTENSISNATYELAKILVEQGRLNEALLLMRKRLKHDIERFGSVRNLQVATRLSATATIFTRAGSQGHALALARQACAILDQISVGWQGFQRLHCVSVQASALMALRRFGEARRLFDEIRTRTGTANPEMYQASVRKQPDRLLVEILTGPVADTREDIEDILAENIRNLGHKFYGTAEAKALKAALLVRTGNPVAALPLFREAFSIMTARSRQAGGDEASETGAVQRRVLLSEIYLDALAEVIAGQGSRPGLVEEAFRVAAGARAQRVSGALQASASRSKISDPKLAEFARREQDAQQQIKGLYGLLGAAVTGNASEEARDRLRQQIDGLRGARAAMMEEIEARFPDYARLVNPKIPDRESMQRALDPGEALVSFYFTENRALAFVVGESGSIRMIDAPVTRDEISRRVAILRKALAPEAETLADIPAFDLDVAWSLYRDLLRPVEEHLESVTRLVVVNHGELAQVPTGLLVTRKSRAANDGGLLFARYRGVPWLARKWSTYSVPSETSWVALRLARESASRPQGALAAFGDPVFGEAGIGNGDPKQVAKAAPQTRGLRLRRRNMPRTLELRTATLSALPPLPDTRDEVEAIALALGANLSRDVFLGTRATEGLVKTTDLSDRRVVVFATHGLVPGDLDGLNQPALALSAPGIDKSGEDGLLTVSEILGLRLNADWVVLSACNTASGEGAGAEAISGLGRAFFYAGARSLLVTGWPVETSSARQLTVTIFRRQQEQGLSGAEALRRARLELADTGVYRLPDGRTAFSYAHPLFWAPFFIVGDGGIVGRGAT